MKTKKAKRVFIAFFALCFFGLKDVFGDEYPPEEVSFPPEDDTSAGWNPVPGTGGETGNRGSQPELEVLREEVSWEENEEQHSQTRNIYVYIRFNLNFFSSMRVRLQKAELVLTETENVTDEGRECEIGAHKLGAAGSDYGGCQWQENTLFTNNGTSWHTIPSDSLTQANGENSQWIFDVTLIVAEWVERGIENCGFLLRVDTVGPPFLGYKFSSKEGQNPPMLKVSYFTDMDGDWYFSNLDCDDDNNRVFPLSPEKCDGVDNDCDGETDNGELCFRGEVCTEAQCVLECKDECSLRGETKCEDEERFRTCDYYNPKGCLEWGEPIQCAVGEVCDRGECKCRESCEPLALRCEDSVVERCEEAINCTYWRTLETCSAGEECRDGECYEIAQDGGRGDAGAQPVKAKGCSCSLSRSLDAKKAIFIILLLLGAITLRTKRSFISALIICFLFSGCKEKEEKYIPVADAGMEDGGDAAIDAGEEPPAERCEPGWKICKDAHTLYECSADGMELLEIPCGAASRCRGNQCVELFCIPGETQCMDNDTLVQCNDEGSAFENPQTCSEISEDKVCHAGGCVNLCELAEQNLSYIGCEYFSTDLDNSTETDPEIRPIPTAARPHAIAVSNPQLNLNADIKIFSKSEELLYTNTTIPPKGMQLYELPRADLDGSGIFPNAYRIESSVPVTIYQFNPLLSVETYTNDASLLLPTSALGKKYIVMGWPQRNVEGDTLELPGFLAIVAVEEGTTELDVKPSADIRAGLDVPPIAAGQIEHFTLEQFDALNLETALNEGDLTGTEINASVRVAVFSGHKCANVPQRVGWCDHLEQQMLPLVSWGKNFIAAHSHSRATGELVELIQDGFKEVDVWRILASEDETRVETDPPQTGTPAVLNRGEFIQIPSREALQNCGAEGCQETQAWDQCMEGCCQDNPYEECIGICFETENLENCVLRCPKPEDFEIVADKPIAVGQFLVGRNYANPTMWSSTMLLKTGDPAFITLVPVEQFRTEYIFFTPLNYELDFVNVIAPMNTTIVIDGQGAQAELASVGSHGYGVFRISLRDGAHILRSSAPSGIVVYGYDKDVSYAYPGGLNLKRINPQ